MIGRLHRVFLRRSLAMLLRTLRKPKPEPVEPRVEAASKEATKVLLEALEDGQARP